MNYKLVGYQAYGNGASVRAVPKGLSLTQAADWIRGWHTAREDWLRANTERMNRRAA